MRWRGRKTSQNVEDREGRGGGFSFPGGRGGGRMRLPGRKGGGISIWMLLLVFGIMMITGKCDPRLIGMLFPQGQVLPLPDGTGGQITLPRQTNGPRTGPNIGIDPFPQTGNRQVQPRKTAAPGVGDARNNDEMKQFISVVLADTEDVWHSLFKEVGRNYRPPQLVIFKNYTQTGCGVGMAAMGPFYCPMDQKVYVDLSFYRELKNKFGAPGDFAQAYVIAHEVGHHVQTLFGIAEKVQMAKQRMSKNQANALQVRMELQADCLAGIWANHAKDKKLLEVGDIDEALNAAAKIGDDNIQRRTQGYVVPESFTHGTSKQRMDWFKRGFKTGNMHACDTFN